MDKYLSSFKNSLNAINCLSKKYREGEFVRAQWEKNNDCIFIESGILKMTSDSLEGDSFNLQYLKGDFLILPQLDGDNNFFSMFNFQVVTPEAVIFKLNKLELEKVMTNSLDSSMYILLKSQQQASFMFAKLNDFSINGKFGALCGQLLILGYSYGEQTEIGLKITITITNEEIGHFAGITHSSSVSRLLAYLKKEKVIKNIRNKLYILNLSYLKKIAPKIDEWYSQHRYIIWDEINQYFLD